MNINVWYFCSTILILAVLCVWCHSRVVMFFTTLIVIMFTSVSYLKCMEPQKNEIPTNLVKTVAHVDPGDNYELYYMNKSADVAYYIPNDGVTELYNGDTVYLSDGTVTEVYAADLQGFYIELPPSVTATGLSGTHILNESGVSIGIISHLSGTDKLYCLWYRI